MRMSALRMTCAACGALVLAQTRCPVGSPNLVQGEELVEVGVREASGAFALYLASTTARGCPESPYQTKSGSPSRKSPCSSLRDGSAP